MFNLKRRIILSIIENLQAVQLQEWMMNEIREVLSCLWIAVTLRTTIVLLPVTGVRSEYIYNILRGERLTRKWNLENLSTGTIADLQVIIYSWSWAHQSPQNVQTYPPRNTRKLRIISTLCSLMLCGNGARTRWHVLRYTRGEIRTNSSGAVHEPATAGRLRRGGRRWICRLWGGRRLR